MVVWRTLTPSMGGIFKYSELCIRIIILGTCHGEEVKS